MEPSTSRQVEFVNQHKEQYPKEISPTKKQFSSQKAGVHKVRLTDSSGLLPDRAVNPSSGIPQEQFRPLGLRRGTTHTISDVPLPIEGSGSSEDDERQKISDYFEAKLLALVGLPVSEYPRQYPPIGVTTQFISRTKKTNEKFINLHNQLRQYFAKDLCSTEMDCYREKNNIPTSYNKSSFPPSLKLEADVHFIFRHHPALCRLSFSSPYPYILLFSDENVYQMHLFIPENKITVKDVKIFYSQNNKPVIQQRNIYPESSAAAVAAMLAHERGKTINVDRLCSGSAYNSAGMSEELRVYGLDCRDNKFSSPPALSQLSQAIQSHGSAAVLLKYEDIHCIWVLVDNIDLTSGKVRCRNPYNCEELDVKQQAFCDKWIPEEGFVQLKA
ncbi:hypothetical protein GV64_22400 [Endozoicomonas elysicola]|uniref:Peptidase C39 domain-containing protein n=2 Tax=Endozoicomonas elysicola TaxID=305900 RepID=A0A081KG20_9GAMM|nr:hypothetical protein GV64_22400 [Endozoicomonas elysicola]